MVNGWCMGGGHELALWCDLVIASENAVLGQTGAKVGACPTVGATQYLPRIIGERLAREMIFCARRFTAKEAVEIGLINKCVPQKDLLKETLEVVRDHQGPQPADAAHDQEERSTSNPTSSIRRGSTAWSCSRTSGARRKAIEGMNAFLEGRKPDFQKFRMRNKRELDRLSRRLRAATSTRRRRCARSKREQTRR